MPNPKTPADLVEATINILQRGLPPGDLDDKQVVTELWGLLDTDRARSIYLNTKTRHRSASGGPAPR
jgi:hypothetical protein